MWVAPKHLADRRIWPSNSASSFAYLTTGNSQLMTDLIATIKSYNRLLKRYIRPEFKDSMAASSHDHILNTWQLICIYSHLQHSTVPWPQLMTFFDGNRCLVVVSSKKMSIANNGFTQRMWHSFYDHCVCLTAGKTVIKSGQSRGCLNLKASWHNNENSLGRYS